MQHCFIQYRSYEIHYTAWGKPQSPAVVLWHGLTRTGRDFDELAQALSANYYVICPDTLGRGLSQWSREPLAEYRIEVYADMAYDLLQQLGIQRCAWVGTSMGGLIGMMVAAQYPDLISRFVVNDVGPEIPPEALARIKQYAGIMPEFTDYQQLLVWIKQVFVPFGKNSEAFWQRMALTSARRKDNGMLTLHYDPNIILPFQEPATGDLWEQWRMIQCPMLLVHGEQSDILLPALVQRMLAENPCARLASIANVAHAPTLANAEQVQLVLDFLNEPKVI